MLRYYSHWKIGLLLTLTSVLTGPASRCLLAEDSSPRNESARSAERRGCDANLKFIWEALQVYRREHGGKMPNELAELTPLLIRDPDILICPVVQQRGGLRAWRHALRDPGFDAHTSYGYEFTRQQIALLVWRGLPKLTQHEVKARQMAKLDQLGGMGGMVPVVRCFDHGVPNLNLAFNGRVYESDLFWEDKFSEWISTDDLDLPGRLFADRSGVRTLTERDVPPRDPRAPACLLDLTRHYNGLLDDAWQGFPGNDLAELPSGLQEFGHIPFDVRGVVQLDGMESTLPFPEKVQDIAVQQNFRRIHFLQGVTFSTNPGDTVGTFVLHYENGETVELHVVYGREVADWWYDPADGKESALGQVAWTGQNAASAAYGQSLRLYQTACANPFPGRAVTSLDFSSCGTFAAPFLLAITLEP